MMKRWITGLAIVAALALFGFATVIGSMGDSDHAAGASQAVGACTDLWIYDPYFSRQQYAENLAARRVFSSAEAREAFIAGALNTCEDDLERVKKSAPERR